MFRGLISGLIMGAIICGLVLATLSLVVGPPRPAAEAPNSVDVAVPAGSEFNRDRPEAPPVIPGSEDTSGGETAPLVANAEGEATPLADTTPASVPDSASEAPDELAAPSTSEGTVTYSPGDGDTSEQNAGTSPTIAQPTISEEGVPTTPEQPAPAQENTTSVSDVDAADTTESTPDEPTQDQPSITAADDTVAGANGNTMPTLETAGDQTDTTDDASDTGGTTLFTTDNSGADTSVETPKIKLPTIGNDGETAPVDDDILQEVEVTEPEATTEPESTAKLGALARNSRPFTGANGKPLMSIVLIDVGDEGLGQDGLSTFSFPITIALDPTKGNGVSAATKYRAAGLEVLIQTPSLPADITPEEVGERLKSLVSFIPQAIGVVDSAKDGFGSNRRFIGEAIDVLNEGGHGLLTYDRGLNTAQQMAEKEGLPSGIIFRTIDADREDPETIMRYLDRAAFRAGQDGNVIMIGHSYSETVTAIFTWYLENRATGVTLAPVSAILRQ